MGSNGFVTETAHLNVDKDKFASGYDRIFGGKKSEKTKVDLLAEKISSESRISYSKALSVINIVSRELQGEIDTGLLAQELLDLEC